MTTIRPIRRPTPSIPKPPAFEERAPRNLNPAVTSPLFEGRGGRPDASGLDSHIKPNLGLNLAGATGPAGMSGSTAQTVPSGILQSELILLKHLQQGTHFLL